MPSISAPSDPVSGAREGWLYDGATALRHEVRVELAGDLLRIEPFGDVVPIKSLRPLGDRGTAVFGRANLEGWRLGFDRPLPTDWAAALPRQEYHGGILDRIGVLPAIVIGAVLAAAALFILAQTTSLVARLVPKHWEVALGDAVTGDFGGAACHDPAGQKALDALAARLDPGSEPVRVSVVRLPMVNAVALPGRQVVIFDKLIQDARSPDEVAGVLGHEIGHVEKRHVMTALIREFGLSLLVGGADGGAIANSLVASHYSRGDEHEADLAALAALDRADISPAPTAGFFARLGKEEEMFGSAGRALGYVSTHPVTADRQALFADALRRGRAYRPALDAAQWQALRSICVATKVKRPGHYILDKADAREQ